MLIEVGNEWSGNQLDEFKVSIVWNLESKIMDEHLMLCSMHQNFKKWGYMEYQHKICSTPFKTHVGDLKDGEVIIPFSDCSWNDTCHPNFKFSIKCVHSARSIIQYWLKLASNDDTWSTMEWVRSRCKDWHMQWDTYLRHH
jgi:hypothetical protein